MIQKTIVVSVYVYDHYDAVYSIHMCMCMYVDTYIHIRTYTKWSYVAMHV